MRLLARFSAASVPQTLLEAVATSDHASLLDNPSRVLVWSALTEKIRNSFISATADDWLKKELAGIPVPSFDAASDPYLHAAVTDENRVRRLLRDFDGSALDRVVSLFQVFSELTEPLLEDWIRGRVSIAQSASRDGALALAKLISDRGWGSSAAEVASLSSQYPQSMLRLTVQATAHLLPLWRRILMWDWLPQNSQMTTTRGEHWSNLRQDCIRGARVTTTFGSVPAVILPGCQIAVAVGIPGKLR